METTIQNEDANVIKAYNHLKAILISGETIEDWSIQRRLFALTNRRVFVAATSGRFILIKRGFFGGFDMTDSRWQDIASVKLKVGVFGADLTIQTFASNDLAMNNSFSLFFTVNGLRKEQTENLYRFAQAQDQSWREKRRVRELEEMRAQSGGLNIGNSQMGNQSSPNTSDDSLARLQKAKDMLDNRLITDSEYESIKAKIVNGL